MLHTLRVHHRHRGRHLLAVFVLVWANMALQPCLMALGQNAGHDCPHCPPEAAAPAHPCGEAPAAPSERCAYIDGFDGSAPHSLPLLDDLSPALTTGPGPDAGVFALTPARRGLLAGHYPNGPPVRLRYCVFLI